MNRFTKHRGNASSVTGGMAISAAVSMTVTLVLSLLIAYFLNAGKITWEQAGYWIMGLLFTASFFGSKSAIIAMKRQRAAVSILSGLLYWAILLSITALFFGGNFGAVWETAGIITAGCGSAALINRPQKRRNGRNTARAYR